MFYLIQDGCTVHGYGATKAEAKAHAAQNDCESPEIDDIPMLGDSAIDGDLYFIEAPEIDGVDYIDPTDLVNALVNKDVFTN